MSGDESIILSDINSLYHGYSGTDQSADLFGCEFFYAVGELLKGKKLEDLKLKHVLLDEILQSSVN